MDWQAIIGRLTVSRLNKLARNAGLSGLGRKRKAQLVAALSAVLDDALKVEALLLFSGQELRALVSSVGLPASRKRRKRDCISLLLAQDQDEASVELSDEDVLLPDRGRLDVPPGQSLMRGVEPLPSRPGRADLMLFFEVQELLRRPALSRAIIAAPSCESALLERLLGEGLDDLIESAARFSPQRRSDRPTISVVLADRDSLGSDAGQALVSLAQQLQGRLEIRLLRDSRLLTSSVLAFEETLAGGPQLTALVGSPPLSLTQTRDERVEVAAHMRLSAPTDAAETPSSVVKEWLRHLLRQSRPLSAAKLADLPGQEWVARKVAYKLHFDTAHELRLKHIAETLAKRGRQALPMFDTTAVEPLPPHQRLHLVRASQPWRRGLMLCDDSGAGKTVAAAFILARELRRRRVLASQHDDLGRRALVVAPFSVHAQWREELSSKLGLPATVIPRGVGAAELSDPSQGRRVTICGPATVREHWESLQGFELLVVAEAHLIEETALAALSGIAGSAQMCLVTSGHPAQHDIADMLSLAALSQPDARWDTFTELLDSDAEDNGAAAQDTAFTQLGVELRALATRTRRGPLLDAGALPTRHLVDRRVPLDDAMASAYRALRQLRFDYQARGDRETGWVFIALERAFLSSLAAFRSAVSWVLDKQRRPQTHEVFGARAGSDGSLTFLRRSSYFQRRLKAIDESIAHALASDATIGGKEAALLEVLGQHRGEAVVVFCAYRGTQQRLASVLARAKTVERVDILDASSSLGERMAVLAAFRHAVQIAAARQHGEGPAGVLLCTDEAAAGLQLMRCGHIAINYDVPYNPQLLQWRIRRLQCWGQTQPVTITSLALQDPAPDGWTMDTRVLYCCRQLFGMAEPNGGVSDSLVELDPDDMEAQLAGSDDSEISLLQEPDPQVAAQMEALLAGEPSAEEQDAVAALADRESQYREALRDFWARVSYGASDLSGARGYLFGRLRLALLQGQVGALCAPGRKIEDCYTFHLAVGLRLMVEAVCYQVGGEPNEDDWLIEDEQVYLWAVAPDGSLVDWSDFLMGGGLAEAPHERVKKLVGPDVVDHLLAIKRRMEDAELDAMHLRQWRQGAPAAVEDKLKVAYRHADAMIHSRIRELDADWRATQQARIARLQARRQLAERGGHEALAAEIAGVIAKQQKQRVEMRPTILGTQLFLVLH